MKAPRTPAHDAGSAAGVQPRARNGGLPRITGRSMVCAGLLALSTSLATATPHAATATTTDATRTASSAAAAWARAQQAGVPASAWQQALALARDQALAQAPAQARVAVQPGLLDARLRLAPCAQVHAVPAPGAPAHGRTRVALQCVQPAAGQRAWRVHLPVTVQVWAPTWVARRAVAAGVPLQAEHLQIAETDWAASTALPLAPAADDPPWGRALVRTLPAGAPLRAADLQQRQWFSHGQTVRVHVQGTGFAVVAQGQALGDGVEGRPARVRLPSGRVLTGQPVAEQAMRVPM